MKCEWDFTRLHRNKRAFFTSSVHLFKICVYELDVLPPGSDNRRCTIISMNFSLWSTHINDDHLHSGYDKHSIFIWLGGIDVTSCYVNRPTPCTVSSTVTTHVFLCSRNYISRLDLVIQPTICRFVNGHAPVVESKKPVR